MSVKGGKAGSNSHDLVASVALADLSLNAGLVKEIVAVASKEEIGKVQDGKQPAEAKTGGCEHCHKANPTKRCSKRHPKCLKYMFCDEVCEKAAHQKKKTAITAAAEKNDENKPEAAGAAAGKSEAAKAKKKAAKKAKKNQGNSNAGEFWWN